MPGSSNISGDESIIFCDNMSFDGTERGGKMTTNGQLWIGATASPHVRLGNITSTGGTCTITNNAGNINIEASATGDVQTLTGNDAVVVNPTGGNINVVTANATVEFTGVSPTLTQDFGITNLVLGSDLPALTVGTTNVGLGDDALIALTSGSGNTAIGSTSMDSITTGSNNTAIGKNSLIAATTSVQNVAVGASALQLLTTSTGSNIAVGYSALPSLLTGTQVIGIGPSAGSSYTGAESSNIVIGTSGTTGESNVMRLGEQGSGAGQQLQTHIAGVINTVSGRVVKTTVPGAYPYTALTTDYVILVDTSSARTINLMGSPVTGTMLVIKDNVGSAAANNITITPAAGNIDGVASYTINSNWGSVTLVRNASQWNVI